MTGISNAETSSAETAISLDSIFETKAEFSFEVESEAISNNAFLLPNKSEITPHTTIAPNNAPVNE